MRIRHFFMSLCRSDLLCSLLLITFGIGLILLLYYKKYSVNRLYDRRLETMISQNKGKKKISVFNDYAWCKKQEKYIPGGGELRPITFFSKIHDDDESKTLLRKGWLLYKKNARATVIICHGFMTTKEDMSLMRYLLSDYNVVTFDFRAHGESFDGQMCTLGRDEKNDVIAVAEYVKQNPEIADLPIIVYGFSMGAVASILAQSERPDLFVGAIWDCPFDSTDNLINRAIEHMKISFFGYNFYLPGIMFFKKYVYHSYIQQILKVILKFVAHMDATKIQTSFHKISPKEAMKKITIPFYLIACHNDDKAPPEVVLDMYNCANKANFKRLWISSGRKHFDAFFINPEKYVYKIITFIERVLDNSWKDKRKAKIKEDPYLYCVNN